MNRSTFGTVLKKEDRIRHHSNGSVSVQFTIINKSGNLKCSRCFGMNRSTFGTVLTLKSPN